MSIEVGSLHIELGSRIKSALNGLSKMDFAFQKTQQKFLKVENKINQGIDSLISNTSKIGDFAFKVKDNLQQISDAGIDVKATPALKAMGQLATGTISVADNIQSATSLFAVFKDGASAALLRVAKLVPRIGLKLTALSGPIGVVVGALAALGIAVVKNFDLFIKGLTKTINFFREVYNSSIQFRVAVESIRFAFQTVFETVKFFFKFVKAGFSTIGKTIKNIVTGDFSEIGNTLTKGFIEAKQAGIDFAKTIDANFNRAGLNVLTFNRLEPLTEEQVKKGLVDPAQKVLDFFNFKFPAGVVLKEDELDKTVQQAREKIEGVDKLDFKFGTSSFRSFQEGNSILENTRKKLKEVANNYKFLNDQQRITSEQTRVVQNALISLAQSGLDKNSTAVKILQGELIALNGTLGTTKTTATTVTEQMQFLQNGVVNVIGGIASSLEQGASSFVEFGRLVVQTARKAITALIKLAVVRAIGDSFAKLGVLALPLAAGIGSAAAGIFNTALNTIRPPELASGGLAYGDTFARIGEYANAHINPEVVQPVDKLKKMISDTTGNVNVYVSGTIKGSNIDILKNRVDYRNNRIRTGNV